MDESLLDLARRALEMAKAAGAEEAWASVGRHRSVQTRLRDGSLEKVQESRSRALSIDLWVNGRAASHRSTDLREEALRGFLTDAVALTRALQPDPDRRIPDAGLFPTGAPPSLELDDPSIDALSPEEREAACRTMDAAVPRDGRVISSTSELSHSRGESASASSNGFAGQQATSSISLSCEVTVRDEGDKRPEGDWYLTVRHKADLPDLATLGSRAHAQALARLGSTKGPSRRATVVVDPRVGGRLVSNLLGTANAQSIQQGRSLWADKLGQKRFPAFLSITDDPLLKRGLASRAWDGEGIAARPLPLIRDGALQNLYVDTVYGRKLGRAPTTGSASNRVIAPGTRDLAALLSAAGDGVYVTSWLGGNVDGTSGDFSLGLRGHRIEGGQVGAPVGEMNLTGNVLDLFAALQEVGNDPWTYAATRCPTLVFGGLELSGA